VKSATVKSTAVESTTTTVKSTTTTTTVKSTCSECGAGRSDQGEPEHRDQSQPFHVSHSSSSWTLGVTTSLQILGAWRLAARQISRSCSRAFARPNG
jgi:hypothetical protein